jgi:hypothetical protein
MRVAAYVYPGWHPIPERDQSVHPGFTEWELVYSCAPRFADHAQPRLPLWGRHDDRDPVAVGRRVRAATLHGVDALVYGFFWCRGKRVFQEALDEGLLGSAEGRATPFALMWANRMPRRVLPVRRADLPVVAGDRRVPSDVDDFVRFIAYIAERYFRLPNYLHIGGRAYFSIFDSTFFLLELGLAHAAEAIRGARRWLDEHGLPGMHLAAIEPAPGVIDHVREVGFDSVTNYVLLPYWKGPRLQDYAVTARRRAAEWPAIARRSGLPYFPSVSPGWDASPRAADFGVEKPGKYPWSPVVTGEHPERFADALARAARYARSAGSDEPMVLIASLNEWSEGHYLEPDTRFGMGWLEAVRSVASG